VDLFFAISGYVIAASLSRDLVPSSSGTRFMVRLALNWPAVRSFFIRRLWRIFPPLLATLTLAALLTLMFAITTWKHLWVEIVAALTMTYNYVIYGGGPFLLDVLWSLAIEMQFYLLLPFFLIAFSTNRQRLIAATAVFLVIGGIVRPAHIFFYTNASHDWLAVRVSTHCRLDTLAAGIGVFALSHNLKLMQGLRGLSRFTIRGLAFFCIMILLLIPAGTAVEFSNNEGFSVLALAAAGVVFLAAGADFPIIPASPVSSILRYVGERSFSLYLVHRLSAASFAAAFPAVVGQTHVLGDFGLKMRVIQCVIVIPLTFAFAELMYQLVEKTSMEAGRRFGRRSRLQAEPTQIRVAAGAV
jgi:peptidoglycan/LPS O-acetylase OafA/YrhL